MGFLLHWNLPCLWTSNCRTLEVKLWTRCPTVDLCTPNYEGRVSPLPACMLLVISVYECIASTPALPAKEYRACIVRGTAKQGGSRWLSAGYLNTSNSQWL